MNKGTYGSGVSSPAHRDDKDFPRERGIYCRPSDDVGMVDAILREKAETEAGGDHREDPVISLASDNLVPDRMPTFPFMASVVFAMNPVQISVALHVLDPYLDLVREPVISLQNDHHAFAKQR